MTTHEQPEDRQQTISAIWADPENRWLYVIVGIVTGFLLGFTIKDFALGNPGWRETIASLFPEAFGITITILVLNALADRRVLLEKKRDLIFKMGSSRAEIAVPAAEDLRRHKWLMDGSLRGADLEEANLPEAKLMEADLREANLMKANLPKADLTCAKLTNARLHGECDLRGAGLIKTDLRGALLSGAKLEGAKLWEANMQDTVLVRAQLQGANLMRANLQGANLEGAEFDKDTIFPDLTNWTPDIDKCRFTDPDHPDFRSYPGSSPQCPPANPD